MKKLIFTLVLALSTLSTWAETVTVEGIKYSLDGDKAVVQSNSYSGDIVIPESFVYDDATYTVTGIAEMAFFYCSGLKSVEMPNTVTTIGSYAFFGCSSLTSVKLSDSLESTGSGIFGESGIKSIEIPNSLKKIESSTFSWCNSLESVKIGSSVASIEGNAFENCHAITTFSVDKDNTTFDSREDCNALIQTSSNTLILGCKASTIPNTVTSIGKSAFGGCTGLTSITIPESVTSIGEEAFFECTDLTSITMANSLTSIGAMAFSYSGLTTVAIPNSVTSIGASAFSGCANLTSATLSESLTSIEKSVFYGCLKLKSISIPESVTSIGEDAFYYCSSLKTLVIGSSVSSIGNFAFYECYHLETVTNRAVTPQTISTSTFYMEECDLRDTELYVPQGSVDAYKAADIWQKFSIKGIEEDGIESIKVNDDDNLSPRKVIENGKVVIEKADRKYSLSGQRME